MRTHRAAAIAAACVIRSWRKKGRGCCCCCCWATAVGVCWLLRNPTMSGLAAGEAKRYQCFVEALLPYFFVLLRRGSTSRPTAFLRLLPVGRFV